MNAEAIPAGQLACLLYDAAEGICADVAAVMLIDRLLSGAPYSHGWRL